MMKKETKRLLVTLLGLLTFLVVFAGCAAPGSSSDSPQPGPAESGPGEDPVTGPDTPKDEGKLFFTFGTDLNDSVEEVVRSSAAHTVPLVPTHIMITVKDASSDDYLLKRLQLELLGTGKTNQFISPAVEIPAGSYTLEEFIVLNDKTIIYVAPRTGSKNAGGVTTPLGIPVTVSAGSSEDLTIEILPCQNENLVHYGYQSLEIKPANRFANMKPTATRIHLSDVTDDMIKLEQYDGYLYMYDGAAVSLFDIADPTKPVKLASAPIERVKRGRSYFVDFKVTRDGVFVVYSDYVYTFRVYNRAEIVPLGRAAFDNPSYRIVQAELAGQYLYVLLTSDPYRGTVSGKLSFLTIGDHYMDPGNSVYITNPSHISVFGNKLFLFHYMDGSGFTDATVLCLDIRIPYDPVSIGFEPRTIRMTKTYGADATMVGNLMFLDTSQGTLVYKQEGDTLERVNGSRSIDMYGSKVYSSYLMRRSPETLSIYSHTEGKDFKLLKEFNSPSGREDHIFRETIWIDSNLYAVVRESGEYYLYLYGY